MTLDEWVDRGRRCGEETAYGDFSVAPDASDATMRPTAELVEIAARDMASVEDGATQPYMNLVLISYLGGVLSGYAETWKALLAIGLNDVHVYPDVEETRSMGRVLAAYANPLSIVNG